MCNLDFSSDIYIPTRKFYPSPDAVRVARIGWKVLSSRGSGMDTGLMVTPGYLPFVTEEVWSWWQQGSIHQAPWPAAKEVESLVAENSDAIRAADEATYDWATQVLFEVRKQRSEAKQPLKVPITKVTIKADANAVALMPEVDADLRAALRVQAFEASAGEPREIVVAGYEPAAT